MGIEQLLGAFEEHVLLSVARHGDEGYGMLVRRDIAARTGRDVSIGAVYATLTRLEKKGFVASRVEPGSPERGGRIQRFFQLSPVGGAALRTSLRQHRRMWDGLDPDTLLGEGGP